MTRFATCRRQAKRAEEKGRTHEQELEELRFCLTEVGEVSYRKQKVQGKLAEARHRIGSWGNGERLGSGASLSGVGLWALGGGLAIVVALTAVYMLWPLGEVETAMFRGGPARTGVYHGSGPKTAVEIKWAFETEDAIGPSSPAVAGGIVYIGSEDNHLYAVDAETGRERWGFETENEIYSSPAVVDGVVYVGSWRNLYAVDAETGQETWHFEAETVVVFSSSPAVAGGVLSIGSFDNHLYALEGAGTEG